MMSGDEFYDDDVTSGPLDEATLRTRDLRRTPAPDSVIDRIAKSGHSRHGFGEKCWNDEYTRALSNPMRDQADHYADLLRESEA